jgi:hypothetical protein
MAARSPSGLVTCVLRNSDSGNAYLSFRICQARYARNDLDSSSEGGKEGPRIGAVPIRPNRAPPAGRRLPWSRTARGVSTGRARKPTPACTPATPGESARARSGTRPATRSCRAPHCRLAAAGQSGLPQRRGTHQSAHPHRVDGTARDQHECALLLQSLVQHVHCAQMEGRRIVLVRFGRLLEGVSDLQLRLPEDDARLLTARSRRARAPATRRTGRAAGRPRVPTAARFEAPAGGPCRRGSSRTSGIGLPVAINPTAPNPTDPSSTRSLSR